jgi:DNA-binding NtrC family response regulator
VADARARERGYRAPLAVGEEKSSSTLRLSEESQQALLRQRRTGASLVIYHRNGMLAVPLSGGEPLVVGRQAPADVVIDDPSLSRRHASFTRRGGAVWIEDLGSTNGTRLRGERLSEASPLAPGDEVMLGSVLVALHAERDANSVTVLSSHDELCIALEREMQRAKHYTRSISVLMVRAAEAHYGRWVEAVRSVLQPFDSIAIYSPEAIEVLLPEARVEEAMDTARAIVRSASESDLGVGVAAYPLTATTPDQMLEACRRAAMRASANEPVVCAAAEGSRVAAQRDAGAGPVVESPAMRKLFETVDRVARSAIPVLLRGETGTGKEVVARTLVERGPRRDQPLVCVNCGAVPPQLVESTLFGHEKGAFTGAAQANPGVFLSAAGGTVLLDEIGELPPAAQAALLRVLEAKVVTRVGSSREIAADVRVLAATHRDLEAMVEQGSFRRDLLYRLNAVILEIPPLRERVEEIPTLVHRFLREANAEGGSEIGDIHPDALALLRAYPWPGNLRELRNAIERAVVIAQGDTIMVEDLPERVRAGTARASSPAPRSAEGAEDVDYNARLKRYEVDLILDALGAADGNQTEAAKRLRMPLRTLVHKIKTLGIKRAGFTADD